MTSFPLGQYRTFGIAAAAPASNTLSGFRTANELRNRSAKAAEASNRRLRAKGFQLEAQPAPLIQEG